ncbi:MAG: hypothetical protein JOZ07_13295 [Solirubrobacterales bacterium]|nr:hypothetical protein [Solirubrobacterales bacterium]
MPRGRRPESELMTEPIELTYDLHLLPAGRVSFRRWRWALWSGPTLLAAGWRLSPLHAQRALRARALRHVHRLHGLHPLRLETAHGRETPWQSTEPVVIDWGVFRVVLRRRDLPPVAGAAVGDRDIRAVP